MYYRLNKYNVKEIGNYLKRIFRYNSLWNNNGWEFVQFPSGSEALVFEQFFEENERYPIVTIGTAGGTYRRLGIDDSFGVESFDPILLGRNATSYEQVSSNQNVIFPFPSSVSGSTLSGISIFFAYPGQGYPNGWGMNISLYSNYTTSPTLVATSSYGITEDTRWQLNLGNFYPYVNLNGSDYWMELSSVSGSTYFIGIDSSAGGIYQTSGSIVTNHSGSIVGELRQPTSSRIGTAYESSLIIRVQDKNNTARGSDIQELISMYVTLGKYAYLNRASGSTDGMVLPNIINDVNEKISELSNLGIFVRNVSVGAMQMRPRGENDRIFVYPITLDLFTEWYEDFEAEPLEDVETTINSFTEI